MRFPNSLTLSRSFYQEARNKLCQFSPAAFGALNFSGIVFSYAENSGKFLLAFRATIVIAGHQLFLLSFEPPFLTPL